MRLYFAFSLLLLRCLLGCGAHKIGLKRLDDAAHTTAVELYTKFVGEGSSHNTTDGVQLILRKRKGRRGSGKTERVSHLGATRQGAERNHYYFLQ